MFSKVLLVIPARYGSKRLPGKPLKKIGKKTMIQIVYERAKKINCAKTIVATDDKRILKHCLDNKMDCVMTKKSHSTGSDRTAELSKKFNYPWILNLQGDEPLINVSDVKKQRISDYIQKHGRAYGAMWKTVSAIMQVKDKVISQFENQGGDIQQNIPGHTTNSGEGYVLAHPEGDIKLVPRATFSAANRAVAR